jgi:phage terminase large subunit GpA-like protein
MNMLDGYEAILDAVVAAWELPEDLTISAWADQNRILPTKGAAEPGPWRTSRTPYLREIMDVLSPQHPATDICFMAASQVGKTEVLLNWIGYVIDHAPAPMLVVQPTVDTAEKYSKQRIAPMIELSERLTEKVPPARSRDSGNTTLVKDFPGGMLVMTGSNAASSLASMPIKNLGLDETDRYPTDVEDEGDPISLSEQRTVTFPRAKRYKSSTPGRKETSHISKEYEMSSQAQYYVPCPHCHEKQVLRFEHLRWEKTIDEAGRKVHKPETAVYMCQCCGEAIEERHKTWMLAEENGAEWRHRYPDRERLGYHINALYSPIGLGLSWPQIAAKWLAACRDKAKLQPFVNLQKGEPYEDHADRVKGSSLKLRAEEWPVRTLPPGILVLTLGVDVQQQPARLHLHLVGWGENERAATIDRVEFYGDPEKPEVWEQLTAYRRQPIRNAFGVDVRISMTAIDTGYATHRVYNYVRQHRADGVIAIKGAKTPNRPILAKPTQQDVKNDKGIVQKNGVQLWMVGTDTAKAALYARLDGDQVLVDGRPVMIDGQPQLLPPEDRMVRFPAGLPDEFYEQLTAETFDDRVGKWVKLRQRNEDLDTWVYAYAAACHPSVRINRLQAADWEHLRQLIEPRTVDLFSEANLAAVETVAESEANEVPAETGPPQQTDPVQTSAQVPAATPAAEEPQDDWLGNTDNWLD